MLPPLICCFSLCQGFAISMPIDRRRSISTLGCTGTQCYTTAIHCDFCQLGSLYQLHHPSTETVQELVQCAAAVDQGCRKQSSRGEDKYSDTISCCNSISACACIVFRGLQKVLEPCQLAPNGVVTGDRRSSITLFQPSRILYSVVSVGRKADTDCQSIQQGPGQQNMHTNPLKILNSKSAFKGDGCGS